MNEVLLWLILLGTALTVVLVVVVLVRSSWAFQNAGKELRDELRMGREEAKSLREEISATLKSAYDTLSKTLESMGKLQENQLESMTKQLKEITDSSQRALENIRTTFDIRVKELQEGNEKKLEEMRKTVDEKLHDTLEKRLGESLLVSERLEAVQKGLGEMQALATGVADLKRVLTNVKTRGTWGEVQLGAILEQILTNGQYERNVRVNEELTEAVEYAIRLPGPKDNPGACVWLPIDSKFPQEDYLRLQEAAESADAEAVQRATEALAQTVRKAAKETHDKYIHPPATTDFALCSSLPRVFMPRCFGSQPLSRTSCTGIASSLPVPQLSRRRCRSHNLGSHSE